MIVSIVANRPRDYFASEGKMANFSGSAIRKTAGKTTRAVMLAAATMTAVTAPALARDFTQKECKGIAATAIEVLGVVGPDKLSPEFKQSFRTWMGPDLRCLGPKEIVIVTHEDDATYATIRDALLRGSKPLSLEKAGLRVVERSASVGTGSTSVQKRSDAETVPAFN